MSKLIVNSYKHSNNNESDTHIVVSDKRLMFLAVIALFSILFVMTNIVFATIDISNKTKNIIEDIKKI